MQVKTITTNHNATEQIENETQKWTFLLAQENNKLKNGLKNLELVEEQIANGDAKVGSKIILQEMNEIINPALDSNII